jgi:TRAP-type transport system periplasmic protein
MLLRAGWWFLVHRRAWDRIPRDIQEIVSKNINAAAMTQREDVAKQINSLKSDLTAKGLIFNDLDPATFSRSIAQVRVLRGMEN